MPAGSFTPRSRVVSTSAMRTSRRRAPSMASIAARRRCRSFTTPVPMVPKPMSPARISCTAPLRSVMTGTAECLANAAYGLARAVLVLDQREPHVLVPVLAESDSRRHRHLRLLEQELRKLDRAHRTVGLG